MDPGSWKQVGITQIPSTAHLLLLPMHFVALSVPFSLFSIEKTAACTAATNMCKCWQHQLLRVASLIHHIIGRDNVEGPYYEYSGRNMYDIRRSSDDKVVSEFFVQYLNLPDTQDALGIERGFQYKMSSNEVYAAFQQSGDYIFSDPLEDISYLLRIGVRVVYVACPGGFGVTANHLSQTQLWRCRLYWKLVYLALRSRSLLPQPHGEIA